MTYCSLLVAGYILSYKDYQTNQMLQYMLPLYILLSFYFYELSVFHSGFVHE